MQYHHGMAGWLTVKGAWAVLDEFWQILQSIHLLGQRTKINGFMIGSINKIIFHK